MGFVLNATVFDETSSQANAQTANYEVNEHLYPLVTFKSKYDLHMVITGHRESGLDLAPAIREHSTFFVRQLVDDLANGEKIYTAEFYEGIEDGTLVNHQFSLKPVPDITPAARYDPDETVIFQISD